MIIRLADPTQHLADSRLAALVLLPAVNVEKNALSTQDDKKRQDAEWS